MIGTASSRFLWSLHTALWCGGDPHRAGQPPPSQNIPVTMDLDKPLLARFALTPSRSAYILTTSVPVSFFSSPGGAVHANRSQTSGTRTRPARADAGPATYAPALRASACAGQSGVYLRRGATGTRWDGGPATR